MTLQVNLKQIKADGASNNYVLSWSNAANSWTSVNVTSLVPSGNATTSGTLLIVDSTANTSATIAASANSVKTAYDTAVTAQNMAANAYSNAASVAATAYSNAVSTASSDATTKAATAYSNATSYADAKAANAYSNATSYADTIAATAYSNAASKAADAYTNAVAYAAANTYVNSTFAPLASPSFTGTLTANNVSITGNLTVNGTMTYVNSTNLTIGDNIITLNADVSVGTAPTENAGLEINRGSSANVALRWNETSDIWQSTVDGTNYLTLATNNDVTTAYTNAVAYAASNTYVNTTFAPLAGATFTGNVSVSATFAAGNTTITGKLEANTGLLSANTIQFNDGSQQSTYIDPIAMAIALG